MKRLLVLFVILSLLLSACSTIKPNITDSSGDVESDTTETQSGATDSTNETTATTEGIEETGSAETTRGTENADGTGAATTPVTGNSDLAQDNTKPTTGSTEPTQGTTNTPPTTGTTDPTEGGTTNPPTGTTPTEPTTQPTTPTQPTTQPTTPTLPAETLKINTKNDTIILVGKTLQIDYTYSGNKNDLSWEIRSNVATVNNQGVVTAKAEGSCVVTVTDINGQWAMLSIVVEDPSIPDVTSIEMDGFNAPLYDGVVKYAGDYMELRAWTLPVESNRNITVTSSNNNVVSVSWEKDSSNDNYITLKFKSAGSATVTLTSGDGAVSKSYSITVKGDYACNPGSGQLTPEQFVNCYNGVSNANGMSTSGTPTGYLVLTVKPQDLTWNNARPWCEGRFHAWWKIGYRTLVLTYEGTDENGNHVFYERGY